MQIEWDEEKAASNLKKHRVSFTVAALVFGDQMRIEEPDEGDYDGEERWRTTGLVIGQEIVLIYVPRPGRLRIISARKAEKNERTAYWQNRDV